MTTILSAVIVLLLVIIVCLLRYLRNTLERLVEAQEDAIAARWAHTRTEYNLLACQRARLDMVKEYMEMAKKCPNP
ncbi:MAG TPA: hypothetical protein VFM34_11985 [Moraxellaceae bacterium]|nr:hypothetical protein [Moraxellaceae bacterium]